MSKPRVRMKTVVKAMQKCVVEENCSGCYLQKQHKCQEYLMKDALWYLEQQLEKSKGKRNVSEIY